MRTLITLCFLIFYGITIAQIKDFRNDFEEATRTFKERNYKEAENQFKALLEKSSQMDSVLMVECQFGLAKSYVHQGKSAKSMPIYYDIRQNVLKMNNDSLLAEANFSLSSMFEFRSQYDSVEVLQHQTLGLNGLNKKITSDIYTLLGRAKSVKFEHDSAEYYIRKAINIDLELNDSSSLPYNYLDLGRHFKSINYPDSTAFYSIKGLDYLRKGKDDFKIPSFHERISAVLIQIGNIPKAKEYAILGLQKAKELNLNVSQEKCYLLLGEVYRINKEYKKALPLYYSADSLNKITNKSERLAFITRGKIECQLALDIKPKVSELAILKEFIKTTQSEAEQVDCELVLLKAQLPNLTISEFYKKKNTLREQDVVSKNLLYLRKLLDLTYSFEINRGLWENAVKTNEELKITLDSLARQNTKYIVHDLEAQYKKREQDKQIQFLDNENSLKEALINEKNTTIFITVISLMIVSLLGLLLLRLFRKVQKQKEIIGISLTEKDTLLREIHHRVKNNLQVISSLLRLQSNSTKDEAAIEALKEGQSRVQSMSLIHQNLYGKDNLTGIGMKNYLEQLSNNLVSTYSTSNNIILETEIEDLKLDVETVVPLGLIINELITNSLKYAFPNKENGKVLISLYENDGVLELSVKDNGVGFDSQNIEETESFGFSLIQAFTSKLDAEMTVNSRVGTEVKLFIKEYQVI